MAEAIISIVSVGEKVGLGGCGGWGRPQISLFQKYLKLGRCQKPLSMILHFTRIRLYGWLTFLRT